MHACTCALRFDYFCLTDTGCATSCCLCRPFILEMAVVIMLSSLHHLAPLFLYLVSFCNSISHVIFHLVIFSPFTAYPCSQMKRHLSSQIDRYIDRWVDGRTDRQTHIAFQFLSDKCRYCHSRKNFPNHYFIVKLLEWN